MLFLVLLLKIKGLVMYILISDEAIKKDKVINIKRQEKPAASMSRLSDISIAKLAKLVNNKDIIKLQSGTEP